MHRGLLKQIAEEEITFSKEVLGQTKITSKQPTVFLNRL